MAPAPVGRDRQRTGDSHAVAGAARQPADFRRDPAVAGAAGSVRSRAARGRLARPLRPGRRPPRENRLVAAIRGDAVRPRPSVRLVGRLQGADPNRPALARTATAAPPAGCGRRSRASLDRRAGHMARRTVTAPSRDTASPTRPQARRSGSWHGWRRPDGRSKSELETEKRDSGLDEYAVRSFSGGHHLIAICLLAGAFFLTVQQD